MTQISIVSDGITVYFMYDDKRTSWRAEASIKGVKYSNPTINDNWDRMLASVRLYQVTKYLDATSCRISIKGGYVNIQFYRASCFMRKEKTLGYIFLYGEEGEASTS